MSLIDINIDEPSLIKTAALKHVGSAGDEPARADGGDRADDVPPADDDPVEVDIDGTSGSRSRRSRAVAPLLGLAGLVVASAGVVTLRRRRNADAADAE